MTPRRPARFLRAAFDRSFRARPDFLIVGAQKAGTTSLHAYLSQHPQIVAASRKELHYFDLYRGRGLGWYLGHFPLRARLGGRKAFEATPDYLFHEGVPEMIRDALGRPKLVVVLRDPAERAYSAWRMCRGFAERADRDLARADMRSFSDAIEAELAAPGGGADRRFHYVAMGRYHERIAAFRAVHGAAGMLVLDYHRMADDLHGMLATICDFLDLPPFARAAVDDMGATRHWVGPSVPPGPPGDAATLARLRDYYAPHDERLFAMLGRRLSWRPAPCCAPCCAVERPGS